MNLPADDRVPVHLHNDPDQAALAFYRAALADSRDVPREELDQAAAAAGIDRDTLRAARRRLNITSMWCRGETIRLHEARCIVCRDGTDHVDPDHGLPLHPDCPSPIRTWRWRRPRSDGKRGREDVMVAHRADTWRTGANEVTIVAGSTIEARMATCSSIFDTARAGQPNCTDPVVWKVGRTIGRRLLSSPWCDRHLPESDRPDGAS